MENVAVQSRSMATKKKQLMIRVDDDMNDQIEAYAARLREETGLDVTASDAVRKLIAMGLAAAGPVKSAKRKA